MGTPAGVSGTITSGPWQVGTDANSITTDLTGTVINWNISGALPGLDISQGGSPNGEGYDNIFGDRPSGGTFFYGAQVLYEAGSRKPGSGWTIRAVPEPSTFALLIVTIIGAGFCTCRCVASKMIKVAAD